MTSELYIDDLLEDGREFSADAGLECWAEDVPDSSGVVWHNTSYCSAREINAVIACEVSIVRTRGRGGGGWWWSEFGLSIDMARIGLPTKAQ